MTRLRQLLLPTLFILAALPSAAQTGCKQTLTYYGDSAGMAPGAFNIQPLWTYSLYDIIVGCTPPSSAVESCPTCPHAAQPIVLSTGNTYMRQSDVQIPGIGGGLSLVRTWNSLWPSSQAALNTGIFGPNWRSTYEERMFIDADDHYIRYSRADGSYWSFAYSGINPDGSFGYHLVAPANVKASLRADHYSNWVITFHNGEQRAFYGLHDAYPGKLLQVIDRNGNVTQLTYDAAARLTTVTDAAGRHLNFTYGTGNMSYLVTGVSVADISLSYTYDPQLLRLTKVTLPDNTFTTFEYDSHGLISAVKDVDGKVLEAHTYDSLGRGLTSSRANGVDAITVSYPQ